ncbi:MAG: hypothetical protein ABSE28_09650 [Candidatus Sulfotelmatobacter sp.]|jgi:hypothetical protein
MNQVSRFRFLPLLLVGALFFFVASCQKKNPPAREEAVPTWDRVAPSPAASSQTVLHKTFSVSTSAMFPFVIPAHTAIPRLHGNYKSFVKQVDTQSDDDSANVDFLVLTEDQYADFTRGHAGEPLFSADASHDQDVNVSLPPSQDQPQKYYLVFRNSQGGAAKKLVQADFTVDF